jgi:serine/threonine protein kinase
MADDLLEQRLGSFTVKKMLGQGGMAAVYRAVQHGLGREVALKVIHRIPGDAQDLVARFQREKEVMQKLEHPNILPIYDYASNASYLWIAMRLVEGGALEARAYPLDRVSAILRQLASALDFAHSQGVVHRDIKPANVLVDASGHLYLTDFGVAKMLEQEGLTAPGVALGTPEYRAPEQLRNEELTGACDQYQMAVMVYQMVTGRLPFEGSMMDMLTAHVKTPPENPRKYRAELPEAAADAILKALAKEPSQRFSNLSEFAQAFESGLGSRVLGPSLPSSPPAVYPWKGPLLVGLAFGAIALAALAIRSRSRTPANLGVVFLAQSGQSKRELQWRQADGKMLSLGPVDQFRAWPGQSRLVYQRNGVWFDLDLKSKKPKKLDWKFSHVALGPSQLAGEQKNGWFWRDYPQGKPSELPKLKDPEFSPDGKQLAYVSEGEIWVVALATGKRRSLTAPPQGQNDSQPCWSPDGTQLAFVRNRELHLCPMQGEESERKVDFDTPCHELCWAPGADLLFSNPEGIYRVTSAGSGLTRLVEPPKGVSLKSPLWVTP